MSYDEEHQRRSRVVVETPTARREVVHSQTVRAPERAGYSAGMVAAVALAAIAATAIIFLFMMNRGDDRETSVNVSAATAQPTPIVQQPPVYAPQPAVTQPTPIVVQQPPPTVVTQPAPVVVPPATTTAPPATTAPAATAPPRESSTSNDAAVQASVDRAFSDDATLNSADVTAVVLEGKVTLNGTVNSEALKQRAQRLAYSVRGVRSVENKIVVTGQ